ncbi:hypothetical protein CBS101457_003002 [Exobasidium rhododendri]|nr:hypothetical protein CBS101457_003002 [Exobasidium rhododendri]
MNMNPELPSVYQQPYTPYDTHQAAAYAQDVNAGPSSLFPAAPPSGLYDGFYGDQEYNWEDSTQPASMMESEQMSDPSSDYGIITRAGPYIRPYEEYRLQVSDVIVGMESEDDLVHGLLSDHQNITIMERLRAVRPTLTTGIKASLKRKLKAPIARDLLSTDPNVVEAAIARFYPKRASMKGGGVVRSWMDGLTYEQRIQVIEELADATDQSTDTLREQFLRQSVPPSVAIELLNCTTREQRLTFALTHGLIFPEDHRSASPWRKGLSRYQIEGLKQRLTNTGFSIFYVMSMLQKRMAPPNSGKTMLRADEDTFLQLWADMRGVTRD